MWGAKFPNRIVVKFCIAVGSRDEIIYAKFCDQAFSDVGARISGFSNDFRRRPYNTLALPCHRLIHSLILFREKLLKTFRVVMFTNKQTNNGTDTGDYIT